MDDPRRLDVSKREIVHGSVVIQFPDEPPDSDVLAWFAAYARLVTPSRFH
jgi:hypothetical protein